MKNTICIFMFWLFSYNVNSQIINIVRYPSQSDIKVYICNQKYEADVIVCKVDQKYKVKEGRWWLVDGFNINSPNPKYINVYFVKYKSQADFKVFISDKLYEIKVTEKYIDAIN